MRQAGLPELCCKGSYGQNHNDLYFRTHRYEAKAILQHSDWNVSEISYALGIEYPTYFNNYFKKQTGTSPFTVRLKKKLKIKGILYTTRKFEQKSILF